MATDTKFDDVSAAALAEARAQGMPSFDTMPVPDGDADGGDDGDHTEDDTAALTPKVLRVVCRRQP